GLLSIVFTARRDDFHIPYSPKRQRGDGLAGKPVPALTRCEKLIPVARQTKPSAPPSLLCKGLQSGWGRRFRLPGQFFTRSDAWGYLAAPSDRVRGFRPCSRRLRARPDLGCKGEISLTSYKPP